MVIKNNQLDLINGLLAKEMGEQQFIDSILHEIKNLKYLRSELETLQSIYHDEELDFGRLSAASNTIGNSLYFLASLAYVNSNGVTKYKNKDRDWYYDKIVNKGPSNVYSVRSPKEMYNLSKRTLKGLEAFIMVNQKRIDSKAINNRLVINTLDSFDNAINYLKYIK